MHRILATALTIALATPASARERCTSMCHFFEAWALAKTCKKLTLNDDGRQIDKDYGDLRALKRKALDSVKHNPKACEIDCKWSAEAPDMEQFEGTACQYLRLKLPL